MCKQIKFSTAVLVSLREVVSANQTFSAYDVTRKLRDHVNRGEIELVDRKAENIGSMATYSVEHNEVKEVLEDLYRSEVLNLNKKYDPALGYNIYSFNGASTGISKPSVPDTFSPKVGKISVIPTSVIQKQPSLSDVKLLIRISGYLKCRVKGTKVTMKQIQSCFKDEKRTCKQYLALLASNGYIVYNNISPLASLNYIIVQ